MVVRLITNKIKMKKYYLRIIIAFVYLLASCSSEQPKENPGQEKTIVLSDTIVEMKPDRTYMLTATVIPPSDNSVVWVSSDPSVVSVFMGKLTSKKEGIATVSAIVDGLSASCEVIVYHPQYTLIWEDNFDGSILNESYWTLEKGGGGGNGEKQYYTEGDNIKVENGLLTISARKEQATSNMTGVTYNYTSARIITKNKVKFTYGKIEASISLPSGRGTWPAFWLMPNDSEYGGWPRSGEIDIMEHVGSDPRMISHAYHTKKNNTSTGTNWSQKYYKDDVEGFFHTYTLEWEEDYLDGRDAFLFYVDGERTAIKVEPEESTWEDWPFDKDFYMILNLAIGGSWGGTIDDSIFENPVEMKVDWVKVYQRK